ncbi:hypothetical protein [Nocardiopsis dassonvillei]|uniref:hypothetical protein n=1 Tax=Nocardiopsis dassonvillei TaxID=2014 RepID=UPI00366FE258
MTLSPSPLTIVRRAFEALGTPPSPMVLEVPVPHGSRSVELPLLAARLPCLNREFSDQVWRAVTEHVRTNEPEWVTAGVGLAVKPLWSVVGRVSRGRPFGARREELEAELIAAWISQLHEVDTDRPDIFGRMWAAAYKVGQRWRYTAERDLSQLTGTAHHVACASESGHPEVALTEVVAKGAVTRVDAELIAATRIDRRSLREVAWQLQMPYGTAKRRRQRAEQAVTALLLQEISG